MTFGATYTVWCEGCKATPELELPIQFLSPDVYVDPPVTRCAVCEREMKMNINA